MEGVAVSYPQQGTPTAKRLNANQHDKARAYRHYEAGFFFMGSQYVSATSPL